jgi:predicted enzyme related to lactoylglutathione lyase
VREWNTAQVEVLNSNPVLAVHDIERSAAWYRDVLGCETRDPDPGNWTFCRSGAIDFMLGRCPDAVAASELGDHSYVAYLRVDDVEAFHERAVNAGAEILKSPTDEPWGCASSASDRRTATGSCWASRQRAELVAFASGRREQTQETHRCTGAVTGAFAGASITIRRGRFNAPA